MPLPSRRQTFAYEDCRELLQKLRREIDRYREVVGRDEDEQEAMMRLVEQLKDSAFNASVTAWHMSDWVFSDMTADQRRKLRFEKLRDLQEHAKNNCRALYLCRYAATASKHWVVGHYPDPEVSVAVEHDDVGWIISFVDHGQELAAYLVFETALAYWTAFIRDHDIAGGQADAEVLAVLDALRDAQGS